jgi:hypothetical protein
LNLGRVLAAATRGPTKACRLKACSFTSLRRHNNAGFS